MAYDEVGRLWANGDTAPKFALIDNLNPNPGAIVFWTERGLGVYVHPKSYRSLGCLNSWDMVPDTWVPIVLVATELPAFVTENQHAQ
ncbi:hypothetical protein [Micromonospora sp. WMMD1082]|uniref:hypothetical protein n=1 Tax=Micromonospora sp. WMMD1082 TaxID=3016104 RepID=UPI0024178CE3|nr:hypothetical protein [Micromonospora sp. WMMD1082]MDG4795217.1 hypothetical protein [Micromonospora sp. WMMD1082]